MIITLPKVWRQEAHLHIAEFAVALLSDNVDENRSRKFGYRFAFDENLSWR